MQLVKTGPSQNKHTSDGISEYSHLASREGFMARNMCKLQVEHQAFNFTSKFLTTLTGDFPQFENFQVSHKNIAIEVIFLIRILFVCSDTPTQQSIPLFINQSDASR